MPLADLPCNDLFVIYKNDPLGEGNDAFGVLMGRHWNDLRDFVKHELFGNSADAEDIVQEAFLQLTKAAEKFDPEKHSVVTWVFWLAKNRAKNEKRRMKRGLARCLSSNDQAVHELLAQHTVEGGEAEAALAQNELIAAFWAFVGTLTPTHRAMLTMHLIHGVEKQDLAREFGLHRNTIGPLMTDLLRQAAVAMGSDYCEKLPHTLERRTKPRGLVAVGAA